MCFDLNCKIYLLSIVGRAIVARFGWARCDDMVMCFVTLIMGARIDIREVNAEIYNRIFTAACERLLHFAPQ